MQKKNAPSVVVPLPEPRLEHASGQLGRVAGDDTVQVGDDRPLASQVDECWLDSLADGLARDSWLELDLARHLPEGLVGALANEADILNKGEAMAHAGIGRGREQTNDRSVRRDRIAWLEGVTEPQALLFRFLDQLREGLNRRLFLNLKRYESHYATYRPGDFYKCHLDSFRGRASRVVSLVLYLNDDWHMADGGQLRVFHPGNESEVAAEVLPQAGRAVLFMSEEVPHEVLPANRTRFSIACWFRQDEVPLPL
ncbi:2OG-Fe(II) oxygenase [Marinobacter oulmenensis]|uniref:SM-20-related protein n=1 Tax=Marinobacter oulmenensis TaxID=643747 RepID=A0A840U4N3_9GAMM|nr:2OG-Fe(II) oxygenase [Marinobacter oulmenensis]MBB5320684.1 SM-20-related protein [Marinobacter oulmenensis]